MKSETASTFSFYESSLFASYGWLALTGFSCATSYRLPLLGDITSKLTSSTDFIFCSQ